MQAPNHLPLTGIRVIEIGQALAGPLAGAILADMGADVIKVEKPDGGDDARQWGPPFGPDGVTSLYFYGQNRNKRSITLDLKNPDDIAKLEALCETADILIQNLRPGVTEKLGIDGASLCSRHPRLIYCNISSYGQTGPLRYHPGFDPLLQAYGGMMAMTGRPAEDPNFCGASINDKATGMLCIIGALAALRQRDATGKGSIIDTSLFESAVHWVEGPLTTYFATGNAPSRHGTGGITIVPYQSFKAADHPFVIAAGNDRMFAACATVLGHPEWGSDPRFATAAQRVENKETLIAAMQTAIAQNHAMHGSQTSKKQVCPSPLSTISNNSLIPNNSKPSISYNTSRSPMSKSSACLSPLMANAQNHCDPLPHQDNTMKRSSPKSPPPPPRLAVDK